MKSWKKRWQEELDAVVPMLNEEVKNAPIESRDAVEESAEKTTVSLKRPWYAALTASPRRLISCISACAVALAIVSGSIYFGLRPVILGQDSDGGSVPVEKGTTGLISVEVNPQAVFSVDENGKVTAVVAANADADVVLSENRAAEMEGKTVEEAVEIFVDYTAQLGYLDLSKPDAVRVTACEETTDLESVGDALKNYFCEKGAYIAVAEETVDLEDFCTRTGLAVAETVEALSESVKNLPELFFERSAQDKTTEELQTLYRGFVSEETIKEMLESSINAGVKKVEARRADIEAIETLADAIFYHEDNGFLLHKDYWELKDTTETLSEGLRALCEEMTAKLADYKEKYGKELTSALAINGEKIECTSSEWLEVWKSLSEFTMDAFKQYFTLFTDSLNGIGVDTSWLTELYQAPAGLSDYLEKAQLYTEKLFAQKIEAFGEEYGEMREALTAADYDAFTAQIVAEYGDLSEYWKKSIN